jgi:hypothetical protein
MAYAIRTTFHLQNSNLTKDSDYIKQIYVRNRNWNPDPAPIHIENNITTFEKNLKQRQNEQTYKLQNRNLRNLTHTQSMALRQLKQDENLTIKPTDKNLGPAIMETETYIKQILKEHLLTKDYQKLPETTAKNRLADIKHTLKSVIDNNQDLLSKAELTYFQRSYKCHHRIPIFYGLPKVHKTPMTLRPVVSSSSSFLSIFSVWLDHKMKTLIPLVQSYIQNSITVANDLKSLEIPEGALLFSADATSMYTNIDTETGVSAIRDFIATNLRYLPQDFPTELFLQILSIVMENNIFTFAGTYWLQLSGTAMGTPAACAYATISYGHHENTKILPAFRSQLLYYKRYIDDIFGIWLPPLRDQAATWNSFKHELDNWGKLKWVVEEPSLHTNFLDLSLHLNGSTITTSTYQKNMNLYLYIPPSSSHPPSCLKGLITGKVRRYFLQNNSEGFEKILIKFIGRLTDRGHKLQDITPLLLQAAATIDRETIPKNTQEDSSTLYVNWTYHPNGLQRTDLRSAFNTSFQDSLPYDRMQVAIARPKNLRDILTKAKMTLPRHLDINQLIDQISSKAEN